jgi:hypothetical protein
MKRRDDLGTSSEIDIAAEESYWQANYSTRPYVTTDYAYDDYAPAYRYGVESYGRHRGRSWDEAEADLQRGWDDAKANSRLTWERAKHAARDAWQRLSDAVERAMPGDSDRDGR